MNDLSLLSPIERKVYECIPVGSAHPISQEQLANLVKVSRRAIAEIVNRLRHKGFLIGSSRAYPATSGYYKISNENEYFICIGMLTASRDNLTQTIKAMTKRHSEQGLEPNVQKKPTEGQLDLLERLEVNEKNEVKRHNNFIK